MSSFTNVLIVSPLADGKSWVIMRDFGYDVGAEGSNDTVNVEPGFVTDFASVPRVLWWAFPKWGLYGNAAVIHDWLYWEKNRSREEADRIMLEAMEVLHVPRYKQILIYHAVRMFGGWAWQRNTWDKESGFSRIITDPHIKSAARINRPGIFIRTFKEALNKS